MRRNDFYEEIWAVTVGGVEVAVNLTKHEADCVASEWRGDGYEAFVDTISDDY